MTEAEAGKGLDQELGEILTFIGDREVGISVFQDEIAAAKLKAKALYFAKKDTAQKGLTSEAQA